MTDETAEKNFLNRWSARKLGGMEDDKDVTAVADLSDPAIDGSSDPTGIADAPPPDLPDIDTLDAGSDYTAFLGDNVPRDLAKLAFRKLWRSDPVLANIDGLNDYDEDYSMVGKGVEIIKSAYRVGKGYATDEKEEPDDKNVSESPEADTPEEGPAERAATEQEDPPASLFEESAEESSTDEREELAMVSIEQPTEP